MNKSDCTYLNLHLFLASWFLKTCLWLFVKSPQLEILKWLAAGERNSKKKNGKWHLWLRVVHLKHYTIHCCVSHQIAILSHSVGWTCDASVSFSMNKHEKVQRGGFYTATQGNLCVWVASVSFSACSDMGRLYFREDKNPHTPTHRFSQLSSLGY